MRKLVICLIPLFQKKVETGIKSKVENNKRKAENESAVAVNDNIVFVGNNI